MAQPNRRQVSLRTEAWNRAAKLRDELAERSGRKASLTDTIERALQCLEARHARGAWLSPQESAPVWEARLRDQIAFVLVQFAAKAVPDRDLTGINYNSADRTLTVIFEGEETPKEIPLLLEATGGPKPSWN